MKKLPILLLTLGILSVSSLSFSSIGDNETTTAVVEEKTSDIDQEPSNSDSQIAEEASDNQTTTAVEKKKPVTLIKSLKKT